MTRTLSFGGSPTASRLRVRSFSGAGSPVSPMGGAMGGESKNDLGEKGGKRGRRRGWGGFAFCVGVVCCVYSVRGMCVFVVLYLWTGLVWVFFAS